MLKILDTSSVVCVLKEIQYPKLFDLCIDQGHKLCITKECHNELMQNPETYQRFQEYGKIDIFGKELTGCVKTYRRRYPWIHDGEASVLCLGRELTGEGYCIIDEKARNVGKDSGILTTGTIGLILWEKEKDLLSKEELIMIKDRLEASAFRVTKTLLDMLTYDN